MAAPKNIIQAAVRMHQYINTCAPSFVQEAAITALAQGQPAVDDMVKEYQRRRDYVVEAVNRIDGLSCKTPKGSFYIFINIKKLGKSSMEIAEYLLDTAKIAMVPGSTFGTAGEGYLRLSFACGYEDLVEACVRLEKAVARLRKKT
jgi:aspartate/methionine/tyrosine aminotransferase